MTELTDVIETDADGPDTVAVDKCRERSGESSWAAHVITGQIAGYKTFNAELTGCGGVQMVTETSSRDRMLAGTALKNKLRRPVGQYSQFMPIVGQPQRLFRPSK